MAYANSFCHKIMSVTSHTKNHSSRSKKKIKTLKSLPLHLCCSLFPQINDAQFPLEILKYCKVLEDTHSYTQGLKPSQYTRQKTFHLMTGTYKTQLFWQPNRSLQTSTHTGPEGSRLYIYEKGQMKSRMLSVLGSLRVESQFQKPSPCHAGNIFRPAKYCLHLITD